MLIDEITIRNFKSIKDTTLKLAAFNVIVGANGSGKSSVLQALHWMFQSGRNPSVYPRKAEDGTGVTLSERDATYMPSPDYKNAGFSGEYGNRKGSPQLDLSVKATSDEGAPLDAAMFIKSARNEGLSVHVPTSNQFITSLRDSSREFSAYIPGLAGIPLNEEKRTKLIVHRLAAAGDANTVLRNVLFLLNAVRIGDETGLDLLTKFVSKVMGYFTLQVSFDESSQTTISASFQTGSMKLDDPKKFKPLELVGIGFLQVIQIFAYLIYFRPVILLVDEPDSHLHPTAQEQLVSVLSDAALEFDTQVILSTHSPSVVRTLPNGARVIWMKDGTVQAKGDTEGRLLMGWGLLDRKVLLMTEDKDTGMLNKLLAQWPELSRQVAVWPFHGSANLPAPEIINGLLKLTGGSLKALLHRDRDFLMPEETAQLETPYKNSGHHLFFTAHSDIESYWTNVDVIGQHFGVSPADATDLLNEAVNAASQEDADLKIRRKKRVDAINKIKAVGKGELPLFGDAEVLEVSAKYGVQYKVLGKDLAAKIREAAQLKGYKGYQSFGESIPLSLSGKMAPDLKIAIESLT